MLSITIPSTCWLGDALVGVVWSGHMITHTAHFIQIEETPAPSPLIGWDVVGVWFCKGHFVAPSYVTTSGLGSSFWACLGSTRHEVNLWSLYEIGIHLIFNVRWPSCTFNKTLLPFRGVGRTALHDPRDSTQMSHCQNSTVYENRALLLPVKYWQRLL